MSMMGLAITMKHLQFKSIEKNNLIFCQKCLVFFTISAYDKIIMIRNSTFIVFIIVTIIHSY